MQIPGLYLQISQHLLVFFFLALGRIPKPYNKGPQRDGSVYQQDLK